MMVSICVALLILLGGKDASGSRPVQVKANNVQNPQVGQVIGRLDKRPDGSCDLGSEGITLSATPVDNESGAGVMEATIDDNCVVTYAGEGKPAVTQPGKGMKGTP